MRQWRGRAALRKKPIESYGDSIMRNQQKPNRRQTISARFSQRGLSLIEFMVSLVIGLMTVAVAVSALTVTNQISGTVNHVAKMQRDASHAFQIIGLHLRRAGAARLSLAVGKNDAVDAIDPLDKVALYVDGYSAANPPVIGTDNHTLTVRYPIYDQKRLNPGTGTSVPENVTQVLPVVLDCQGNVVTNSTTGLPVPNAMAVNQYKLLGDKLVCMGTNSPDEVEIISNVSDFKVKYYVQEGAITLTPTIKVADSATKVGGSWDKVSAIEVCLDLMSEGPVKTEEATYVDCENNDVKLNDRMHMVFRNMFQVRSQGLMTF
jgi:type IV pilus assembly protein PilW